MLRTIASLAFLVILSLPAFTQPGGGPKPVVAARVVQKDVAAGVTLVGSVRPLKTSIVGSAVDGRVLEYPIRKGQRVKKGDTLTQLRTGTIELERAVAASELDLRKHELDELKNGSRVEEKAQAEALLHESEAVWDLAKERREMKERLFKRQAISEDEWLDAKSAEVVASKKYLSSKANYDLVIAGPRKERILQAEARVKAQSEAVEKLSDQISLHTIRAPFDGYVTDELAEVGRWVLKGDPVAEVVLLDEVEIEVNVPEDIVARLFPGADCRIEVSALPEKVFTGPIAFITPQANAKSRTFPVLITVKNTITEAGPVLKSNMFARTTLPVGKPTPAILVPKDAIVLGGPMGPMVYVIDSEDGKSGKVRPAPVGLGIAERGNIAVTGGLKPGDLVVTQGNERLFPGTPVAFTVKSPDVAQK